MCTLSDYVVSFFLDWLFREKGYIDLVMNNFMLLFLLESLDS